MDIHSIQLLYTHKSGFTSADIKGTQHTKTLPFLSVVQAVKGHYDIQIDHDEMQNTGFGGFFIAPADATQTIVHHAADDGMMICRWVFLDVRINASYRLEELYELPVVLSNAHNAEMNAVFDRLFAATSPFEEYVCYYEMIRILSVAAHGMRKTVPPHLRNVLEYVKVHYREKLTAESLAKIANMSVSRFFTVFKAHTGMSPIAYLNNYRLFRATEQLRTTDDRISEIANAVGIDDPVYFNKLFRKAYQLSPSKYREVHRIPGDI